MKLSEHSRQRLQQTCDVWRVTEEYSEPMLRYLVHGFSPGSFYSALLANDALRAFQSSHPGNSMTELKKLTAWIQDAVPAQARGSYDAANAWCQLTDQERRCILEQHRLIYTEREETWLNLQATPHEL